MIVTARGVTVPSVTARGVTARGLAAAAATRLATVAAAVAALAAAFVVTLGASSFAAPALQAADPAPAIVDLTPIRDTLEFPVGVAIDSRETSGAASVLLLHHFSQITAENAMKPEAWYDASRQFAPSPEIAALMDFAIENDLRVYGHVLVWHSQIPAWFFEHDDGEPLTDSPADQAVLRDRMRDHIVAVAEYLSDGWGTFGGGNPVVAFDVVNEAVADDGSTPAGLRESSWYRILGEDYIDLAFEYADEAFNGTYAAPGADRPVTLFINDYNTELADKRGRYLALVDRLLARGVPLDGIGHQFHVTLSIPAADLADALDDASGRGLVQAVTEFDVPTGSPVSQARLVEQGYYVRDAFQVFRDHADEMFSVSAWGLYDARSWRSAQGAPLIFDERLRPKPAYYGLVEGYADETALAEIPVPRDWSRYWIGLGIVALAAAIVAPRVLRARRRAAWHSALRTADEAATGEGAAAPDRAVDALSRPIPPKKGRDAPD